MKELSFREWVAAQPEPDADDGGNALATWLAHDATDEEAEAWAEQNEGAR